MAQEEVANDAAVEKSVTFTALKPELSVEAEKVGDAVTFYKSAFGAVEVEHSLYLKRKLDRELPHVISAELELAGTTIVVCDVSTYSGSTAKLTLRLDTNDVDAAVAKAALAGAVKVGEVAEGGGVKEKVTDPFGFTWIFFNPAKIENDENKEHIIMEEGNINRIRDRVMEQLEHFREFSNVIIGHAIDGFIYRGPDFLETSTYLETLLLRLDIVGSEMIHWIRSLLDAVDEELDEAVPEAALGAVPEVVDEAVPKAYLSRIDRLHRAYSAQHIGYNAFFNKSIELAKKIFNDIKRYGEHMIVLCPTLETARELDKLDYLIFGWLNIIDCIDDDQKELEIEEDSLAGDGKQLRGVW